ncbi:uncharacterized protein LOC134210277 [Armigeres subalbatus]|uniref:uncharacterized protein LOC134210277 n=1 Tax=Armigeres subalbatus TaxID=124917 RepID=UPI002ED5746E
MSHRKNTIVVDFSVLPRRPPLAQVKQFLEESLKLNMADVKSIQLHNLNDCVFIEMNSAGVAARLQKEHHLKHSFHRLGVFYHIPVYVDGPTTTLRIHDLPPRMPNETISDCLKQYGKVISVQNETWKNFFPGVANGVRVVRMMLEKAIPSRIVIDDEPTLVTGQKQNQSQTRPPAATVSTSSNKQHNSDPPPMRADASESDEDDYEDEEKNNNDSDGDGDEQTDNFIESGTGASAKRRLSTASATTSDNQEDNIPKRSCSDVIADAGDSGKNCHSDWKVYNTRSKKK